MSEHLPPQPGQRLARGIGRAFASLGWETLLEYVPTRGLRVDVIALGPKGEIAIVECKSGIEDFRADQKWQGYLPWCDRFYWAVDADFPSDILPEDTGLIIADAYGAEIIREAPEVKLPAARRRAVTLDFARVSARRERRYRDPDVRYLEG